LTDAPPAAGGGSGPAGSPVVILLRNLWPGSFARLAIEEASSLPGHGVSSVRVVAFAEYGAGYRYADLLTSRRIRLEVPRISSLGRRISRTFARPFLPPIRGEESAVPWWEILRWGLRRPAGEAVVYAEDQMVGAGALLRRRLHGTPYVLLVAEPLATREGIAVLKIGRSRLLARLVRWSIRMVELSVLHGASSVLFVSHNTALRVRREFPSLPTGVTRILYPGCHPVASVRETAGARQFLAVSKWDQGRNPNFFLEIAKLRTEQFVIAGTWIDAATEARFRERSVQLFGAGDSRLRITGPLSEEALQNELRGAYCYVHWSAEGFGMGVLEAMAAGVPVVCTPAAGAAELIQDGVNGLLVRQQDPSAYAAAVARLSEDVALRNRLARAALATAREHDWAHHAERLAEALRVAAASAKGSGTPVAPRRDGE
jgi:glycosyltransferase involved in cell wall biosynthesis